MSDYTELMTTVSRSITDAESSIIAGGDAIEAQQRRQKDEEINKLAIAAWQGASLQGVIGDYDYMAAFKEGATFKPGPDGEIQVPNRFVPSEKFNLMGYDLATGERYRHVLPPSPRHDAAVMNLRNSYVNQNGQAPIRDVRPLAELASGFLSMGKDYNEFDANVPTQWHADQKRLAWTAATDNLNRAIVQRQMREYEKLPVMTKPAKFTQEETLADPQFATDARTIYKLHKGEDFQGGDIEATTWLRDHLRLFDLNTVQQGLVMYRVRAADYKSIEAYARAVERWDNTEAEMTTMNFLKNTGRAIADPTNLIGLGPGKMAVTTAGRVALKAVLKRAAEVGAVSVAMSAASETVAKGVATGQPAGAGEIAGSAAVGGAVGAAGGAGLAAVPAGVRYGSGLLRNAYNKISQAVKP